MGDLSRKTTAHQRKEVSPQAASRPDVRQQENQLGIYKPDACLAFSSITFSSLEEKIVTEAERGLGLGSR